MRFQKGACVLEVIENASIHSRPHYRFRFDAFSTGCPLENSTERDFYWVLENDRICTLLNSMRMLQTHAPPIFSGHRFHFDVFCTVHTYDMNNAESGAMSAKSENSITGLGGTILDLALQISFNFTILRLRKLVLKTLYDSSEFFDSTILPL